MSELHNEESDEELDDFCPALPPHLLGGNKSPVDDIKKAVIGPVLPQNYVPPEQVDEVQEQEHSDVESNDSEEDNIPGPMPSSVADSRFNVPEMEYRLKNLIDKATETDKPRRESWMTELPKDKPKIAALGLVSRQFRKTTPLEIGDRSVWTDTPEDKKRKAVQEEDKSTPTETPETLQDLADKRRDAELTALVSQYDGAKRSVPLIESHQKKKKKTDDLKVKERKPFNREDDLCVNKFDEAQKETILKKARQMGDRFSSGNKKFL